MFFHHNTISVGAGLSAFHILNNIPFDEYEVCACISQGKGDLKEKLEDIGIRVRRDFSRPYSYMHVSGYHYPFLSRAHLHNLYNVLDFRRTAKKVI